MMIVKIVKKYSPSDDVDEKIDLIINYLEDWKNGKYNKESEFARDLANNLQKIDVLFTRDIEKK